MQMDNTQWTHRALAYRGGVIGDHSIRDGREWDTLKYTKKIPARGFLNVCFVLFCFVLALCIALQCAICSIFESRIHRTHSITIGIDHGSGICHTKHASPCLKLDLIFQTNGIIAGQLHAFLTWLAAFSQSAWLGNRAWHVPITTATPLRDARSFGKASFNEGQTPSIVPV